MADRLIAIRGETINLAPLIADDVALFEQWMADLETTAYFGYLGESTSPGAKQSWDTTRRDSPDKHFAVLRATDDVCIGRVAIFGINQRHQHAEYGILLGKPFWGQGYGTEATRLMCDYGLYYLGLHNLFLWAYGYNTRAIRAYTKAGFWEVGRMREWIYFAEQWWDAVLMQCNRASIGSSQVGVLDG